ncbi:hypothetical protein [Paenibacillus ferrarius]|uniref:hypothetical protein n=1 Tax=Paenibacillus ferrarius TaxID=1469647 RepID=UPI003D2DAB2A
MFLRKMGIFLMICLAGIIGLPLNQANAIDSDYFGVNDPLQRYTTDYTTEINQIADSQIQWIRISPEWGRIETAKGVYDTAYLNQLDNMVNQLTAKGIHIVWILCYTAPWASSMPGAPSPDIARYKPANWADWESYVHFLTTRYQGEINYWEVWNEQDSLGFWKSSIDDYNTLLQKAYTGVKATDSSNTVLLGGLALSSYGLGTWFDSLMSKGAGNYFDIINYHAYGASPLLVSKYNGMMDIVNKYSATLGSKPIWITETGYSSMGTNEYQKADYSDQVYAMNKRWPNVAKTFWYNYRDTNTSNVKEDNFGLVAKNLSPLKALYHFQALNGAESFFGAQVENALTLFMNTSPADSGVTSYGSYIQVSPNKYAYFRLNDQWLYDTNDGLDTTATIEVTYLDSGSGSWQLQYDGQGGAYTTMAKVYVGNTGGWKTQTYTLNDIKFANRQNSSSDFRIYADNNGLKSFSKVTVRKQSNHAKVILKNVNNYTLIEQVQSSDPTKEPYTTVETIGGVEARKISGDNKYFYFQVSDGFARTGDAQLTIKVSYYDSGTDTILIQYNALNAIYKPLHIVKTGTNTWKEAAFMITDANFRNLQNNASDFRIGNDYDGSVEYIRSVEVIK